MFKKVVSIAFILVFVFGLFGVWQIYHYYQNKKIERVARMQEKVEEVSATLIEGWSAVQIGEYYEELGMFSKKDFLAAAEKFDTSKFPLVDARANKKSLEGYLFPDTYRFVKNATPDEVITKMLANFSNRVDGLGISVESKFPQDLNLSELIALASIIEKESGGKGSIDGPLSLQEERDIVAGVFYNRLSIGQALESDATVNYVTGKDDPAASGKDIMVNSPYNTYKFAGLPPGPICNPSLGSIKAAFSPATTDFMYFLHKQPSGKVAFSKTFAEHVSKKQ